MAPIFEKRPQPPQGQTHLREGSHSYILAHDHAHHGHGKENTTGGSNSAAARQAKKGLEILDFHESWLEEMEIYKDQLQMQKQQQQQLLSSHNHQHTPQGCQFETAAYNPPSNSNGSSTYSVQNSSSSAHHYHHHQHQNIDSFTKRKSPDKSSSSSTTKPRILIRNTPMPTEIMDSKSAQLHLKRPHDELKASKSASSSNNNNNSHAKKHAHSHKHSSNTTTTGTGTATTANGTAPIGNAQNSKTPASVGGGAAAGTSVIVPHKMSVAVAPPKHTAKIIVNQFHASSLLSAHQQEEKTKILTQNGLTKSAATAYETSLYASHYLPQEASHVTASSVHSGAKHTPNDNTNYVGVSLAKGYVEADKSHREVSHHSSRHHPAEDDPCAAIDDVNDYTDSDSEEEYCGYPFYLPDDGKETQQSLFIHFPVQEEHSSPPPAVIGDDADNEDETAGEASEYYTPTQILTPSIFPNVPPYLNFSSHARKGPHMPSGLHRVLKWKLSPVMPKIVKRVVLNSGFRIIKNTTDWMAVWEKHMKSPGFRTIRSHQKYNHMPGSFRIGRKDTLWRSIHSNMKKFGSKEFGFMQKSYIMPDDLESLRQAWPKNASKLTKWIVKPPASARGTGIRIVNKWSQFPKDRPLVVQKYIERPLLINDNKFDMRIYVVVSSINPLRIYMYKDGLARFASVKYSSELNCLDDRCMHLTNYSINKFSQNYSKNEDFHACQGHKWTLQSLWSCLEARGVNTKRLWATLRNLVIKSIISGEAGLNRMYRQNVNFRYNCFELFGFDILLDDNLIPWLLEVNISPSLHSELPLDLHVKGPLIQAVLNTALYQVPPKMSLEQQQEILRDLNLNGPLCHDKRIFTTCLTAEEVRKHNQFTNRAIEFREEYIDAILENLLPDDVRCLIITEDEYARSNPLERVFPTADTHAYLKYIDNPRYYNRLLDAWEHRYATCREEGIKVLSRYCKEGYHLKVSEAAMEKEPNVTLTEIDMLHTKKSDDTIIGNMPDSGDRDMSKNELMTGSAANMSFDSMAVLSGRSSESPEKLMKPTNSYNPHHKGGVVKKS